MKEILKYLSAKNFFTDYAKSVKNYKHKMRGIDGNGKPIEFSSDDKKEIRKGLKKMLAELIRRVG